MYLNKEVITQMLTSIYKYIQGFNDKITGLIENAVPKVVDKVEKDNNNPVSSNAVYNYIKADQVPTKQVCIGSFRSTSYSRAASFEPNADGEILYSGLYIMCGSSQFMDNTGLLYFRIIFLKDNNIDESAIANDPYTTILTVGNRKCYITAISTKIVSRGTSVYLDAEIDSANNTLSVHLHADESVNYGNLEFYSINDEKIKGLNSYAVEGSDYASVSYYDVYRDGQLVFEKISKSPNVAPKGTKIQFKLI